jgi:Thioredoxin.
MRIKKRHLQLRPGHFIFLMILFSLCICRIADIKIKNMPESDLTECFPAFEGELPEGYNFIFFHDGNELSNKMRYNLEQTVIRNQHIHYFEVDVNKESRYYYDYNVSGVPNILIFKGEKEIKRIMGMVSQANLQKIRDKIQLQ